MFLNRDRARQLIDFGNLSYNGMMPTDLDGAFDYKDKGYAFFELKHRGAEFPIGQRLLMERLVKHMSQGGRKAIAIVADHDVDDTLADVDASTCMVRMIFYSDEMRWRAPNRPMTIKQVLDGFVKIVMGGG